MNILLVEDDSVDAMFVQRDLKIAFPGVNVHHALCLSSGLRLKAEHQHDLVLSDLTLPDCDGLDAVVQMKGVCPQCPIVVLSGMTDRETSMQALEQGAQDFLVKGHYDADSLERTIRHSIQRQGLAVKNAELLESLRESEWLMKAKNDRLEKLCQTAQQFVDNISHDFRTPLTVIMEYASLLGDGIAGPMSEEQTRLLSVIDDRAGDLNNMVDDMLDISKLESGLLGVSRARCTVHQIIDRLLPMIRRKTLVREVTVEVDVDVDLPPVFCDPAKVGRVLVNLVTNAIDFSRRPGCIKIIAEQVSPTDIQIGVTDNGFGIPETKCKEIFERFSQVKTALHESTKGFGLGLNIAEALVRLNLGTMSVKSTQDVGSTFSFTLPIDEPIEIAKRFLGHLGTTEDGLSDLSVIRVNIDDDGEKLDGNPEQSVLLQRQNEAERFLTNNLRQNDLLFPLGNGCWILLACVSPLELEQFCEGFESDRQQINRNRPRAEVARLRFDPAGTWKLSGQNASSDDAGVLEAINHIMTESKSEQESYV